LYQQIPDQVKDDFLSTVFEGLTGPAEIRLFQQALKEA